MKSFIPWIGGKTLLAKKLVSLFPEKIDRYVEVFGGGGSVLLYGNEKRAPLEVYNDLNGDLVNLFRCAKYIVVSCSVKFPDILMHGNI